VGNVAYLGRQCLDQSNYSHVIFQTFVASIQIDAMGT
jgi:hypothetical protein